MPAGVLTFSAFGGTQLAGTTFNASSTATLTLTPSTYSTFSGTLADGAAVLSVSTAGSATSGIVLSGTNTYTGATAIGASGVVYFANNNATGTTGTFAFSGGNIAAYGAARTIDMSSRSWLGSTSTETITGIQNLTFSGLTAADDAIITSGAGTTLAVKNAGTTTFSGTDLAIGNNATTTTATISGVGAVNISVALTDGGAGVGDSLIITNTKGVTLSGSNTFTGSLSITTGGLLIVDSMNNASSNGVFGNSASDILINSASNTTSTIRFTGGSNASTTRGITLGTTNALNAAFDAAGVGKMTLAGNITGGTAVSQALVHLKGTGSGGGEVSGIISNGLLTNLGVAKEESGTWTLSGNNTHTGSTTVKGGTLILSGANGAVTTSAVIVNGGELKIDNTTNNTNRLSDSANFTVTGKGHLNFSHPNDTGTYSESVGSAGSGTFTVSTGSSAKVTTSAATGSGTSTLTLGALSISTSGGVLLASGDGLGTGSIDTHNSIVFANNPSVSNSIIRGTVVYDGTNYYWGTLSGSNLVAYTADDTTTDSINWVNTGNYRPGGPSPDQDHGAVAKSANAVILDSGVDIELEADITTLSGILQTGGTSVITSTSTGRLNPSNALRIFSYGTLELGASTLGGSVAVYQSGTGTVLLGAQTDGYTGVINAVDGTIRATHANSFGEGTVNMTNGKLSLALDNDTTFSNVLGTIKTALNSGSSEFSGVIEADRATAGAGVTYTLGTFTISAAADKLTFSKGSNVTSGTAGITFAGAANHTMSNSNSLFQVDSGVRLTFSNNTFVLSNTSARTLTIQGGGTTVFNSLIADNAGGVLSIAQNGGTVLMNGVNTGTGTFTINDGTLGGSGTISEIVSMAGNTASLMAGDGTTGTTLTLSNPTTTGSGAVNFSAPGATLIFALGAGGTHSTLARTGGGLWTFTGNQNVTFLDLGATAGTYDNIITGLAADPGMALWNITNSGWTGTFSWDGSNVDLTLAAVPEPSTYFFLILGGLWLVILRNRRGEQKI